MLIVNYIDVNEWVECREENKFKFKTNEGIIKNSPAMKKKKKKDKLGN